MKRKAARFGMALYPTQERAAERSLVMDSCRTCPERWIEPVITLSFQTPFKAEYPVAYAVQGGIRSALVVLGHSIRIVNVKAGVRPGEWIPFVAGTMGGNWIAGVVLHEPPVNGECRNTISVSAEVKGGKR